MRPAASGRQGLFSLSSATEAGLRWLLTLKESRWIQIQKRTRGRRCGARPPPLASGLRPYDDRASELVMPNMLVGTRIVLRSERVKSHIVYAAAAVRLVMSLTVLR